MSTGGQLTDPTNALCQFLEGPGYVLDIILLAANVQLETLDLLNWRSALFIFSVILLVRPLTVLLSLAGTSIPMNERLLVAFTGPRGVVLRRSRGSGPWRQACTGWVG